MKLTDALGHEVGGLGFRYGRYLAICRCGYTFPSFEGLEEHLVENGVWMGPPSRDDLRQLVV